MELSSRVDPEELREILAAYQYVCASVVRRFEGHIARYFGDGILVYFGYPTAHEDEALRAVRSALAIREGMGQLNERLQQDHGLRLHTRIGIHTGVVVAGDIAPGQQLEVMAAIGETPNVAARLQGMAEPDTIVISSSTFRLVSGYFHCRELGFRPVRGIPQPIALYEVLNESTIRTRLELEALGGLKPMAGRQAELDALTAAWREAAAGSGRAVLITGEPGIGKSRLVWALQEEAARLPDVFLVKFFCSSYFQNTAFHPLTDYLERSLEFDAVFTVEQRLEKLEGFLAQYGFDRPEYPPLMADLLSLQTGNRYPALEMPADRRHQTIIDACIQTLMLRSRQQPVLFVVEDLHWADPSMLELLSQFLERLPTARILTVITLRPDAVPSCAGLESVQRLPLERLDSAESATIVEQIAGRPLPVGLDERLLDKADGVPLYLEELTKLVLEGGVLRQDNDRFELVRPLPELEIPATLADLLTARLDHSTAKWVAQVGATIGRRFSYELLACVLRALGPVNEAKLKRDLARLVHSELLIAEARRRGATYTFKHALIQESAYGSLLRGTRQEYHRLIAEVLTAADSPLPAETAPELLAHHYTQAGLIREAIPWWLQAGRRALGGSAYHEGIAHLSTGLALITQLPAAADSLKLELDFRLTLGPAYMATRGYGAFEVEECYHRARVLCGALGNPPELAPVLYGLWTYHIVRGQHLAALELGRQIVEQGTATNSEALIVQGNLAVGWSHFFLGNLAAAREHLESVLGLYDQAGRSAYLELFADDPSVSAGSCLAQVYWLSGYPDRARRRSDETLATLQSIKHPYSAAFGMDVIAFVLINLGDATTTRNVADQAIQLSQEHGLPLTGSMAEILRGYALTQQGELEQGLTEMRTGLTAYVSTGADLAIPHWYWLLAEATFRSGDVSECMRLLDEADKALERTQERYWEPEVHRLRGEVALAQGDPSMAESCFHRASEVANSQAARSLQLRAVLDLARLRERQARPAEALKVLEPACELFVEGLETPDLREARVLLAQLSEEAQSSVAVVGPPST